MTNFERPFPRTDRGALALRRKAERFRRLAIKADREADRETIRRMWGEKPRHR